MDFSAYRRLWAIPVVRQAILIGFLGRTPWFGAGVILTLHIVNELGMPYSAAGVVSAVFAISYGLASPWRGRMLDTVGLRRTLLPSLVVLPVLFLIAPWVSYWWLMGAMALAGALSVPWFPLIRAIILRPVAAEDERAVMSLDSLFVEFSFMLGPAGGIVACVYWGSAWALVSFSLVSFAGAVWLYLLNPPLIGADSEPRVRAKKVRWFNLAAAIALLASLAANFSLAGTDLALIAVMKAADVELLIGPAMAVWAVGSLVGGFTYGAIRRRIPLWSLVAVLSVATILVGLAPSVLLTFVALFFAGLFCAPTITAGVEMLNRAVPVSHRGEAMGWQGTASTVGSSLGPPVVGWAIDHFGAGPGFVLSGLGGGLLFVAGVLFVFMLRRMLRRRRFFAAG